MVFKRGFTLIELMMIIAIAAVLLSIAVPSFRNMIERNQVTVAANTLLASIHAARTGAINQSANVLLDDGADGDWSTGWRVCIDSDPASNCTAASATIINEFRTDHDDLNIVANGGNLLQGIIYTPNGRASSSLDGDFYHLSMGEQNACILFSATGRPVVTIPDRGADCP